MLSTIWIIAGCALLLSGAVYRLLVWRIEPMSRFPADRLAYLAHRGVPPMAPENTMPAFRAAYEAGADVVELDVVLTKDGIPVVQHNFDLERSTDGSGYIWDHDLAELAGINAAYNWGSDYPATPIPTLEEVLRWLPEPLLVNIELKPHRWRTIHMEEQVLALVQRYKLQDRTIISSFNPWWLMRVKRLDPTVAVGYIWWEVDVPWLLRRPSFFHFLRPHFLHPSLTVFKPKIIEQAHRRGVRVNVWTVNNAPAIQALAELGVDGIFTDFPELMPPRQRT